MSERAPRPPWIEFRSALEAAGFRPSRRLGQNFLLDENSARAIARDAAVNPGEFVLEIGPGCGFLSVHLAHAGARLLAVEIDTRLAPIARDFLAPYPDAQVLETDVLAGKHLLHPLVVECLPADEPWVVCANLPYNISGPVLALLASLPNPPRSMTTLVQLEVARRLAAAPGQKEWGPLTVGVQSAYRVSLVRQLGPELFWPRPKVHSAVVRLELLPGRAALEERVRLRDLAGRLFQRRRQSLARVLSELLGSRESALGLLARVEVESQRRAETLSLAELGALSESFEWQNRTP